MPRNIKVLRLSVYLQQIECHSGLLREYRKSGEPPERRKNCLTAIDEGCKAAAEMIDDGVDALIRVPLGTGPGQWTSRTLLVCRELRAIADIFADPEFDHYPLDEDYRKLRDLEAELSERANVLQCLDLSHLQPAGPQASKPQGRRARSQSRSVEQVNRELQQLLAEKPALELTASRDDLARMLKCAAGTISNTPEWTRIKEARKVRAKRVSIGLELAIEQQSMTSYAGNKRAEQAREANEQLIELMAAQAKDAAADQRPRRRNRGSS